MTVNKKSKQKTRVNLIGGVHFRKFGMEWTLKMRCLKHRADVGRELDIKRL